MERLIILALHKALNEKLIITEYDDHLVIDSSQVQNDELEKYLNSNFIKYQKLDPDKYKVTFQ